MMETETRTQMVWVKFLHRNGKYNVGDVIPLKRPIADRLYRSMYVEYAAGNDLPSGALGVEVSSDEPESEEEAPAPVKRRRKRTKQEDTGDYLNKSA